MTTLNKLSHMSDNRHLRSRDWDIMIEPLKVKYWLKTTSINRNNTLELKPATSNNGSIAALASS